MKSCAVCGNPVTADVCPLCGASTAGAQQGPQQPLETSQSVVTPLASPPVLQQMPAPTTTPSLPRQDASTGSGRAKVIFGAIAALALVGGALGVFLGSGKDGAPVATQTYVETQTVTSEVVQPQEEPSETEEVVEVTPDDPLTDLEALREESLLSYDPNGRWVVGLSAKFDGITDARQTADSGSNVFGLDDILDLHEQLAEVHSDDGRVFLVLAKDVGSAQGPRDDEIWMTLLDPGGLYSRDEAQAWCEENFADVTGEELANACYPRELDAP